VRETGRDTMGVQLINLGKRDAVVGIARNAEAGTEAEEVAADGAIEGNGESPGNGEVTGNGDSAATTAQGAGPQPEEQEE
jgi:DNA gyrase subunit A